MNKFIVNKNKKIEKERCPSLTPGAEWGRHKLVVSEPRFRCFRKSQGLSGSRIEYMIENPVFSNVLA